MSLKREISSKTGILISTYLNIIHIPRELGRKSQNLDLFADEKFTPVPNAVKGFNEVLTWAKKKHLVEVILEDTDHSRMTFTQLLAEV